MEELITLVTNVDPTADLKTKYKRSNMACNILTSEIEPIINKLISDDYLLAKLWSFIETDERLDSLLASYFSKVVAVLLKQKPAEMLRFMQTRENAVNVLLAHIDTSAIMDLVVVLTSCCENAVLRAEVTAWLNDSHLVPNLIDLIRVDVEEARQGNASQALCDMTRMSRDSPYLRNVAGSDAGTPTTPAIPDVLLQTLEDADTMSHLLDNVLKSTEEKDQPLINGINVLLVLMERQIVPEETAAQLPPMSSLRQTAASGPQSNPTPEVERFAPLSPGVVKIVKAISAELPRVQEMLTRAPTHVEEIESSGGDRIVPLGNARLQLVRLIVALFHTGVDDVQNQFIALNTMQILLDLFFDFELNNFLHMQVEQAVISVIMSGMATAVAGDGDGTGGGGGGGGASPLFASLLTDAQLLQRIVRGSQANDVALKSRRHRLGYMGHLTRIAEHVAQLADSDPSVAAIIDRLPEEERRQWDDFTAGTLSDLRRKNEVNLGGKRPMLASFDESGDSGDDFSATPHGFPPMYESEQQQEYVHYQTQQMSNDFVETFGFDEEEFPSADNTAAAKFDRILFFDFSVPADENPGAGALFEACCQQKIKPYDESDDEEDEDEEGGGGDGDGDGEWEERELTFDGRNDDETTAAAQSNSRRFSDDDDDEDDDDEEGGVHFEWTAGSDLKQVNMEIEVPEWAQEPTDMKNEDFVGSDGGGGWADFSKLSEADQPKEENARGQKYTTELAFEMMNKESSDGPVAQVDSEDDSDDSEERSGDYSFSATVGHAVAVDEKSVEVKAFSIRLEEEEESPLPESEQGLSSAGAENGFDDGDGDGDGDDLPRVHIEEMSHVEIEVDVEEKGDGDGGGGGGGETDSSPAPAAVENSVGADEEDDEEELEDNFVFLSSSGILKGSPPGGGGGSGGGGGGDELAEAERSPDDVEKARLEARKAMELYTEATNDDDDANTG